MTAGGGTKPSRSAGHKGDAGLLAELLAQYFGIVAKAPYVRKYHIRPLRWFHGHTRPFRQAADNVIALGLQVLDKLCEPLAAIIERRNNRDLRQHRHAVDRAFSI